MSAGRFLAIEWRLENRQVLNTKKKKKLNTFFFLVLEHVGSRIPRKAFDWHHVIEEAEAISSLLFSKYFAWLITGKKQSVEVYF